MKQLYKLDTKGKQRFLKISTKGDTLIQESGVVGSKKVVRHVKVCKGKNIGKSNETTPEEQAKLEMTSKIAEKLTEGYFTTLEETKTVEVILPMLAKSYADEKNKIDWTNAYVQPKFDGMRCLAFIKNGQVTLMSRKGEEIKNMDHIKTALSSITDSIILDGELYVHGQGFQENMRLIKKYRPGETEKIQYHVYDVVSESPIWERHLYLDKVVKLCKELTQVVTIPITSEKELQKYHAENLAQGYEGSIVRWGKEGYKKNGRSSNLLKYKDFQDIACKITDITPAEARPEWGVPTLSYKGKTFQAGMKYSHAEREDFLKNKKDYIGKTAEIRFFEYTESGIPRFPVMVGIRLDK